MNAPIRKHLAAAVALASAVTVATPAFAASQGSVGATSTGTTQVSVGVPDRVRISNLNDMALTFAGTGNVVGSDTFCVYRNGTGSYDIELSSANPGGADEFRATDGAGTFVDYTVSYDDDVTPADGSGAVSGDVLTAQAGHGTSVACGGSDNASLQVTFAEADLQTLGTGTYADTITLVVSPN